MYNFSCALNESYAAQVTVVGGGPAGVCAAIAAARNGAKTLLIESGNCLGGMATLGQVNPFMTCYDKDGDNMIIRGLFKEIVDRLVARGAAIDPGQVPAGSAFTSYIVVGHNHVTPFDAETLKVVLDEMCCEAGVQVLFHSTFVPPVMEENRLTGLVIMTKGGLKLVKSDIVIDCTGDADVAYRSGVPCEMGDEASGRIQPVTMFFRIDMIVVEGNERYTEEQIIEAAGVQKEQNLVLLNKYKVKQSIFDTLPYVETVVINRKYPDALILTVTECTASAALTGENGTWLMSDKGKILERAAQIPEGCARVTGCTLVEPAVGAMAAFADEDSYKFERLLTLLRTAEDKQLLSMIGEIDLSDGTAITFTYLDRFTVKMPWDADIAYKLGNVRTVVEQLEANQTGTINLMNDGRADFIPE